MLLHHCSTPMPAPVVSPRALFPAAAPACPGCHKPQQPITPPETASVYIHLLRCMPNRPNPLITNFFCIDPYSGTEHPGLAALLRLPHLDSLFEQQLMPIDHQFPLMLCAGSSFPIQSCLTTIPAQPVLSASACGSPPSIMTGQHFLKDVSDHYNSQHLYNTTQAALQACQRRCKSEKMHTGTLSLHNAASSPPANSA